MAERGSPFIEELTYQQRFDNAHSYWQKAIEEGRASLSDFYKQVFESEETEIYRENADDEMFMLIAKNLNETWVGVTSGHGRRDPNIG